MLLTLNRNVFTIYELWFMLRDFCLIYDSECVKILYMLNICNTIDKVEVLCINILCGLPVFNDKIVNLTKSKLI
jgi:hypothetical protein